MRNKYFILISICCIIYVIIQVRKNSLSIKESFWWFMGSVIMLLLSIFPGILDFIAMKFNVAYPPSLLFIVCIVFLLFINIRESKIIASQQEKIIELGQQMSMLKSKVSKIEKQYKKK